MTTIRLVSGIQAAILVGVFGGRYYEQIQHRSNESELSAESEAMYARTESYIPSCADLAKGHSVVRKGKDTFVVVVTGDRFVVFGMNVSPNSVPVTSWWGSGLESVRADCE